MRLSVRVGGDVDFGAHEALARGLSVTHASAIGRTGVRSLPDGC